MILSYAFCNASLTPLRAEPRHAAEMTTELLFGEKMEVLEITENDWARVRNSWDDYEGWCKTSQLTHISKKEYRKAARHITSQHYGKIVYNDTEQWLPMGAELFGLKSGKIEVLKQTGKYKGKKVALKKLELTANNVIDTAKKYMNAPYLWGGRSVAGIDCSGLTQMAYKMCGKAILRDARQQAEQGEDVDFLQHAKKGDLAFFDNAEGKITHVGILIDNNTIIHATDTSGKVVIDRIDQEGIISVLLRKRTHKLRMIKRYI
jgi:cell wall-associated NlpC family hydrolase